MAPNFVPQCSSLDDNFYRDIVSPSIVRDDTVHEFTGNMGDVYLVHPFMLHSAGKNHLRIPRIITNPQVSLKEPFKLERKDGDYSLVEQKTLRALGMNHGIGKKWAIVRARGKIDRFDDSMSISQMSR